MSLVLRCQDLIGPRLYCSVVIVPRPTRSPITPPAARASPTPPSGRYLGDVWNGWGRFQSKLNVDRPIENSVRVNRPIEIQFSHVACCVGSINQRLTRGLLMAEV
jgi:hypothetical protein